jgi:hypothetical protein
MKKIEKYENLTLFVFRDFTKKYNPKSAKNIDMTTSLVARDVDICQGEIARKKAEIYSIFKILSF